MGPGSRFAWPGRRAWRINPTELRRLARKHNLHATAATKQHDGQISKPCPSPSAKIFRLTCRANHHYKLAPSHPNEGRVAIVTNVAMGCGGRLARDRRARARRTAKTCGPDAPTLASSRVAISARRWWQESPVTRESAE